MTRKEQANGFSAVGVIVIIVVIAALGFVGWLVWHKNNDESASKTNTNSTSQANKTKTGTQQNQTQPDPYAGWGTYNNRQYGMSFRYPTNWTVEEVGSNAAGSDPTDFTVNLKFNVQQKYNETAIAEVHTNNLAAMTKFYDSYYAGSSLTVNKKELTLKGKQAVEYDITGSTLPSNIYLFGVGDKTYSFRSADESALQQQSATYRSDFEKVFESLSIK